MMKITDPSERKRTINRVSGVGIVGNIVLTLFKLIAGMVGHSQAMVSDAVHSLSDVFATAIAYLGARLAERAPDENHPYGHERFECAASLVLGIILLFAGIELGRAGMHSVLSGTAGERPETVALIAALVSIVVKEAMFHYTKYYAKRLDSSAFMADAWHHRSDAISSLGSLAGIAGAMLGFPVMDALASLGICLCIFKVAYDIIRPAIDNMLDTSWSGRDALSDFVSRQEGILHIDWVRSRMFGNRAFIDMEVSMDGSKTLYEAHEIAERIHDLAEEKFPEIKHIMIHVNPETHRNEDMTADLTRGVI